jgi:hypothetical protein
MGEINLTETNPLVFKKSLEKENFSDVKKLQNLLQNVSSCLFNKISKCPEKKKELRRKKRLKNHYIEYFSSLNLSPIPTIRVDKSIKSPEVHLKSLVSHQSYHLKNPSHQKNTSNSKKPFNIYPVNSLPFRVFSFLSPPSFNFLPLKTTCTIFSHFPHNEKLSLSSLKKMHKKVEKKLLSKNQLDTFSNKSYSKTLKKIEKDLESLLMIKNNSGIFTKRYKSSQNFKNFKEISPNRSYVMNDLSQDRTATTRSGSVSYRRLGFFKLSN